MNMELLDSRPRKIRRKTIVDILTEKNPEARGWIFRKVIEISADTKLLEEEGRKKLSFNFLRQAEPAPPQSEALAENKFFRDHRRDLWRAIHAYCQVPEHKDIHGVSFDELPADTLKKMAAIEHVEQARLAALRPTWLERKVRIIFPAPGLGS